MPAQLVPSTPQDRFESIKSGGEVLCTSVRESPLPAYSNRSGSLPPPVSAMEQVL